MGPNDRPIVEQTGVSPFDDKSPTYKMTPAIPNTFSGPLYGKLIEVLDHQIDLRAMLSKEPEDVTTDIIIWEPRDRLIIPFTRRVHDQAYIDWYNSLRGPGSDPIGPRHIVHVPIENGPAWVIFKDELVHKNVIK